MRVSELLRAGRILALIALVLVPGSPARAAVEHVVHVADYDFTPKTVTLAPGGTPIARTLRVPPGRHWIRLRSDGAPAIAPKDPRRLVFQAFDAHLRPAGPSP